MILNSIFNEIAILLAFSVMFGIIAVYLRQPLIFSFIIVGIIAGPSFLGWIASQNEIELFAQFGVTLLLFIVGLKLDLHLVRTFGYVVLIIGAGQIFLTAILSYFLAITFGMQQLPAIYVAVAMAFSSTIIVIKLLSDRNEVDSLYGRITVGVLIVQDIVAILAIIFLSSLGIGKTEATMGQEMVLLLFKGIIFLAAVGFLSHYVLPRAIEWVAKSRELLVLAAIAWAVLLAVIGEKLGFGKEVGGFVAGVSLASIHYREAIVSRLETLRHFLLLFFFLNLGSSLDLSAIHTQLGLVVALSIFVLIAKPLIVMIFMGLNGFRRRTSMMTGFALAQISEFSLILAALGQSMGHIDNEVESLITLICLITICFSTYMLDYSATIYKWLSPWLKIFERKKAYQENIHTGRDEHAIDVIIFGFGRHGENIARALQAHGFRVLGIDFDPRRVRTLHHHEFLVRYGDAEDIEFPKTLPLEGVCCVVSTIPRCETTHVLVSSLRERHFQGKIAVSAYHEQDIKKMETIGADLILVPYKDAAAKAAERLVSLL